MNINKLSIVRGGVFFLLLLLLAQAGYSQALKTITGKVSDSTGTGLPNVSVHIQGKTTGVVSDAEGKYSIRAAEGDVLEFSSVGYATEYGEVRGDVVNVSLTPEVSAAGDEIVVVGYGTQKKVNLTGSISTVSAKEIENRPVTNVSQALQGVAAGLNVTTNSGSGEPGGKMSFNIRGVGSINGGEPYVLVDGLEQDINKINPNDIENISVLKDAAASAIYGARAPYGVVLVTTKSGKSGRFSIDYNNNFGWSSPTNLPQMMNSLDFANYWNAASANDQGAPIFNDALIDSIKLHMQDPVKYPGTFPKMQGGVVQNTWATYTDGAYANTDWFKEYYKSTTTRQSHNLSINGGDKKTQFYVSGGLLNENGLFRIAPDKFKRYTLDGKVASQVTDWLKLRFLNRLTTEQRERPEQDLGLFYHNIARRWPVLPVYDPNGHYFYESETPIVIAGKRTEHELTNVTQLGLDFELLRNWLVTADFNFKWNFFEQENVRRRELFYLVDNTLQPTEPNNTYFYKKSSKNFYSSPNIYTSYDFSDIISNKDHYLKVMAGFQQELNQYGEHWGNKTNLISEGTPALNTAIGTTTAGDYKYEWATRGYFGRINYNYKEKYLLEVNGRYDGSSKFPAKNRWGFFPSASLGWNVAKEDFFANSIKPESISELKFRVSYGSLGNQSGLINENYYAYIANLSFENRVMWLINGQRPPAVFAPGTVSDNITWEKPTTFNVGMDITALSRRLAVNFDYFTRVTIDMMGPQSAVPLLVGANAPLINNANLKTNGFDLMINWNDRIGSNFSYFAKFMLSDSKSKILKFYNPSKLLKDQNGNYMNYEGRMLGDIWGFESVGLFQNQEDIKNWYDQSAISNSVWFPGDVKYVDLNGDGKITFGAGTLDDHGDQKVIGNTTPRYMYSLNYGASWKGLSLSMLWQGIGKRDLDITGPYLYGISGDMWQSAAFVQHLDFWTPENPNAYYPRPTFNNAGRNQQMSTRYLQNAAYLRLKNITVSYDLPLQIVEKIKMRRFGIFFSAENLLTFSKMNKIFDPEITKNWDWGKVYPLSKVYSVGVNIGF